MGRKTKYSPALIERAKKLASTGRYSYRSIAKRLGFSDTSILLYHIKPGEKEAHAKRSKRWATKNRKKKEAYDRLWRSIHAELVREYMRKRYKKWKASTTAEERREYWRDKNRKRKKK